MKIWLPLIFAIILSIIVFISLQLLLPKTTTPVITLPDQKDEVTPLPLGRHFMIGHWADTPIASTTALLVKYQLGGIIIMSAPANPADIKTWTETWQAAVSYPLIIAIDQEGGEVSRLRGDNFDTTSQSAIRSEDGAYALGLARGKELRALGITMNFAPVLDTATKPDSFLYSRVFLHKPVLLAAALARGHNEAGVTPVIKHFPGHPDTPHDSHVTLPVVPITKAEQSEFIRPFAEYIERAQPAALMTAHVSFPNIDALPATLSPYWLTTVLRQELGYTGLIITDDMSMDAIDSTWTSVEASRLALTAGADIVLFAAEPPLIAETLNHLASSTFNLSESDARIQNYTQ